MKKFIILCLSLIMSLYVLGSCGKNSNVEDGTDALVSTYYTTTGEKLLLPVIEGGYYECEDKDANIDKNIFTSGLVKNYSVNFIKNGKKTTFIIEVKDGIKPTIDVNEFMYAQQGVVTLPTFNCIDDVDEEITIKEKVVFSETNEEVLIQEGTFNATKLGEYIYTIEALDKSGNQETKQSIIEVTDDTTKKDVYLPLETEWGSQQFFRNYNCRAEYSTEFKAPGEKGSTKLAISCDRNYWASFIFTKNVLISDVRDYDRLVFWVYNDSDYNLIFSPNWATDITLKPKKWEKVSLLLTAMKYNSKNQHIRDNWSLENANSLAIIFQDYTNLLYDCNVYFSNMYLVKE